MFIAILQQTKYTNVIMVFCVVRVIFILYFSNTKRATAYHNVRNVIKFVIVADFQLQPRSANIRVTNRLGRVYQLYKIKRIYRYVYSCSCHDNDMEPVFKITLPASRVKTLFFCPHEFSKYVTIAHHYHSRSHFPYTYRDIIRITC